MLQDGECEYGEGNTMCLVATEATPIAKSPHNICDGCGETVKPDQWSKDIREQVFLCIDCA